MVNPHALAGAGGSVGTQSALLAQTDGYTRILIAISNGISHKLRDDLEFDDLESWNPESVERSRPRCRFLETE